MSELLQARATIALDVLRLNTAKANLAQHLRTGIERYLPALSVLDALIADKLAARTERSIIVNTKLAHLPVLKTLDSFDFDVNPTIDRRVINDLQILAFVERAEGVALLGPARVGKLILLSNLECEHCKRVCASIF